MDTCSRIVPFSFPRAQTILVPPASSAPINIWLPPYNPICPQTAPAVHCIQQSCQTNGPAAALLNVLVSLSAKDPQDVQEQVDINIKYDGYIRRQLKQVEQFKKLEAKKIPTDLDYEKVGSLRIEARQKLEAYRPISIGQASRISGVSPADISVLLVYLSSTK